MLDFLMGIGALPRRCRLQVGVTPKSRASARKVRFVHEVPYLGDLTGAWPYLGFSACQAQGSQKALDLEIFEGYGMILRCCEIEESGYRNAWNPRTHLKICATAPAP